MRDTDRDGFSHDDLWRAENPGHSAARGVLWALALSLPLWAGIVLIVWAVTR